MLIKKFTYWLLLLVVIGSVAQSYNHAKHRDMPIKKCGEKGKIKHLDENGFECITQAKNQQKLPY